MKRILVPISVSNRRFTTALLEDVLDQLSSRFGDITFFLADKLYLYNRVRDVTNGHQLASALIDYRLRNRESVDKVRWLEKLDHRNLRPLGITSRVITIDDVSDLRFVRIVRNVVLAYHTIPELRRDVHLAAKEFYSSHGDNHPSPQRLRLSAAYILEEIGLNIRIRVVERIEYEYYAGHYVQPLLNLYEGKYGLSVEEIAESEPTGIEYRFLETADDLRCLPRG